MTTSEHFSKKVEALLAARETARREGNEAEVSRLDSLLDETIDKAGF